ncbi:DnaD domain protein [Streptococcus sp. sy010]|uniref:DnaD domain protein n=1 Tax=Streptococcus sp. sy010 TaxID=2600148 RepID=UPI0011B4BEDD|nr:DnaD domain protein [Streptococcus sp. sy010]TWT16320.1 helicase loader [Streptococcus sp. sy010]
MKPTDRFSYLAHNWLSPNHQSLHRLYLPVMGQKALSLYYYFVTFFDDGSREWSVSHLLDQLQLTPQELNQALDRLVAIELLDLYQDLERSAYLVHLKAPLPTEEFLANAAFRALLEKALGVQAVASLQVKLPTGLTKLTKSFSAVFSTSLEPQFEIKQAVFDLEPFKKRMLQERLRFAKEQDDVLALYELAERFKLDWLTLYQLAKETSYQGVIYPKRILSKKLQQEQTVSGKFSKEEEAILQEVKRQQPEALLALLKKPYQASLLDSERRLIAELVGKDLLDELINVIIMYSLKKTNSTNLNRNYVLKLANDFAYKKINSAEAALRYLKIGMKPSSQSKVSAKKMTKPNIPQWSNQDYQNQTSDEDKARLKNIKQDLLAQLRKED